MSAPPASSAERSATRAARAVQTVRVLAGEPRPAGSQSEDRAREYCRARLREAGFDVTEEAFEYSTFVGHWGTSIGGIIALSILLAGGAAVRTGRPGVGLAVLALGAAGLAVVARALARTGVLDFPAQRRTGVNLVATRRVDVGAASPGEADEPTVWLMAHVDSKSQPVPILVRAAGITLLGVVWAVAIVTAAVQLALDSGGVDVVWGVLTVLAIAGAIPVIATTVGARSPGALDNATGVATILAAADDARGSHFGVCLTSAEELGLAGARAWVRGANRRGSIAINCDSVDDGGATTCMYSGPRPTSLVRSVLAAGSRAGVVIRAHRLLPGVLTDGVALADAGWHVVTLSKGGVRTLARIHTPRDRADELTGTGMDEVARVIVELLEARSE